MAEECRLGGWICVLFLSTEPSDRHNFKHGNRQGKESTRHRPGRGLFVGIWISFYSLTYIECECNYVTYLKWGEDGVWSLERDVVVVATRVIFRRGVDHVSEV